MKGLEEILVNVVVFAILAWVAILMYWAIKDYSEGEQKFCINKDHIQKTNKTAFGLFHRGEDAVKDLYKNMPTPVVNAPLMIKAQEPPLYIPAEPVFMPVVGGGLAPNSAIATVSPFSNDLPNQDVELNEDSDYNDTLVNMALEKSVIDQHNQYVNDSNRVTNTASYAAERTDSQDVVPWVGLRRVDYGKHLVDSTSRTVPSVDDEDVLSKPVKLRW